MSQPKLTLEILSGPLDGQVVTLNAATEWSRTGTSALSFPWDEELGTPQARFTFTDDSWWLEPIGGARSTRHNGEQVHDRVQLTAEDVLKAANTWLQVKQISQTQKE